MKRLEQAALTSFVQQGMLEVQVMAEREKKKKGKKEEEKRRVRGDRGIMGHGTHFSDSIFDPLNTVFVIAEFFLFLSLCLCLSVQSDN